MQIIKFTGSTQQLKKAGLYRMGARKNGVLQVERFANCTVRFAESGPIIIPENLIYFFTDDEVQALKEGKIKVKNGKVI